MARILILTNQRLSADTAEGVARPYRQALSGGEVHVVSHAGTDASRHAMVLSAIDRLTPDLVVTTTAKTYPSSRDEATELLGTLGQARVAYYDGDAYGGRAKPVPQALRFWIERAGHSFSTAAGAHLRLLSGVNHRPVHYVPYVAPLEFTGFNYNSGSTNPDGITMIANTTSRSVPLLRRPVPFSGLPGEAGRFALVNRLRRSSGVRFHLWGSGWPRGWSRGLLQFQDQLQTLIEYRVSACWDHYPEYPGYFSNRLPIAMLAGRHHVTTDHGGMGWLREIPGVHLESTPRAAAEKAIALAREERPTELGSEAREFVKAHLTGTHLARFILSNFQLADAPEGPPWEAARALSEEAKY